MQLGGGVQITAGNSTAAAAAAPVAANATAAAAGPPLLYQGPSVGPQQIPAVATAVPNATTAATAPVSAAAPAANTTTGVLKEPLHARITVLLSPVWAEALILVRSTFQPVGLPDAWIEIAESMLSRMIICAVAAVPAAATPAAQAPVIVPATQRPVTAATSAVTTAPVTAPANATATPLLAPAVTTTTPVTALTNPTSAPKAAVSAFSTPAVAPTTPSPGMDLNFLMTPVSLASVGWARAMECTEPHRRAMALQQLPLKYCSTVL